MRLSMLGARKRKGWGKNFEKKEFLGVGACVFEETSIFAGASCFNRVGQIEIRTISHFLVG